MRAPFVVTGTIALAMALALALAACDEKLSNLTGPTPNLEPTFSSIQREILEKSDSSGRPACVQCHNGSRSFLPFSMNLTTPSAYSSLVGVSSIERRGVLRVAPNDPDNSYLIHKLEGHDIVGARMPLNGPYLSDGQILAIRRWIALGAPNN